MISSWSPFRTASHSASIAARASRIAYRGHLRRQLVGHPEHARLNGGQHLHPGILHAISRDQLAGLFVGFHFVESGEGHFFAGPGFVLGDFGYLVRFTELRHIMYPMETSELTSTAVLVASEFLKIEQVIGQLRIIQYALFPGIPLQDWDPETDVNAIQDSEATYQLIWATVHDTEHHFGPWLVIAGHQGTIEIQVPWGHIGCIMKVVQDTRTRERMGFTA